MPEAASDAFLSGQGIPVELSGIEDALASLWGPAAEREGGPDLDSPSVTRVTLANLVVADMGDGPSRGGDVLDTVLARYPCRALILRRDESTGRKVAAEVSALCHLPAPGMPQVCSERIVLRAGHEGRDLIPGAVRPLLEADLPLVLWWVGDSGERPSLYHALADEASRVILDLPDPGAAPEAVAASLDLAISPYGRDLSWFGVTLWRELVAQFFDPIGEEAILRRIASVTVTVEASTGGGVPRVGAWLVAWLAGQLGWAPDAITDSSPERLAARFRGPHGPIAVTIRTEVHPDATPAHISGVVIAAKGEAGEPRDFRLVRVMEGVAVETQGTASPRMPRMVEVQEFTIPDRVSAALESARDDPPYRNALPHLLWLLGPG